MRRQRGDGKPPNRLAVQMERTRVPARAPLLPHEHDESPETAPLADPVTTQAHADVTKGLIDTERRGDATMVFNRHRPVAKVSRRR